MSGRTVLLLNVLILAVSVFCAQRLVSNWRSFKSQQSEAPIWKGGPPQAGSAEGDPGVLELAEYLQHDFFAISERDLFRPERRPEVQGEEGEEVEEAPEFPKRPEMNGVTEKDGQRSAWVTVYDAPKAAGESRLLEIGDSIQGYVVSNITDTTLTLSWNDRQEVIDMLDSEAASPRTPSARKAAALNIIRIGSKVAAVETTTETTPEEEARGLQVGVVGSQGGAGARAGRGGMAGQGGIAGRGGLGGATGSGSRGLSRSGQGRGLPSSLGFGGGTGQGNTVRRPQ